MPFIQWYPGHIAKAERQLKEQLNRVDVIFEVLDARIPLASHHPDVPGWIGDKPRLVVLNRTDMIPESVRQGWLNWFAAQGETLYCTNAKQGKGIKALKKAAQAAGVQMNERRQQRGMRPRAVRAVVIGFPNVGKSALINRLLGRKVAASARRAGVTRQLQWIRISDALELLDSPGIIPAKLENQEDAVKLAICEDIGEAAYDNQQIGAALIDLLVELNFDNILSSRYQLDPQNITGEEYIESLGNSKFKGDTERATMQLLNDFRKGVMGKIPLELPQLI
ncbi:ribosome biogenesis GTPase YlqF [Crocosphaera watsonii]|uniref:Ribosome biogenesis GTPase A n=1 Tax=Crocosphaera watsonii WH 8502 TaxID=423474 RepID=T2I8U1_CROWT|nr:ribosome biogenesis GTPase YlqF [Crocosphaera watsonii]CCQ49911.1 50S ribosomal subunit maturation GTPase RbgA (B. subtilis YlqF) [Crocosphaera watsonii WH 8502]